MKTKNFLPNPDQAVRLLYISLFMIATNRFMREDLQYPLAMLAGTMFTLAIVSGGFKEILRKKSATVTPNA